VKILILTHNFPKTPGFHSGRFVFNLAKGFHSLGHKVDVLAPFSTPRPIVYPTVFTAHYFRYIYPTKLHLLGYGNSLGDNQNLRWFNFVLIPFYLIFGTIKTISLIKNQKIDLVNAHWLFPGGFIALLANLITNVPYTVTMAGSDVFVAKQNFFFRLMAKLIFSRSSKIVADSPLWLLALKTHGEVIAYPVPLAHPKKHSSSKIRIGAAGRRIKIKGFAEIQKAIPKIEIFSGLPYAKFQEILRDLDIFVHFPIILPGGNADDSATVVLDAMSAGCAVITVNLPGYQNFIQNNQTGLLVPVNDLTALKKAANRLTKNHFLRQSLGKNAHAEIKKRFTPKIIARSYLKDL
jgi:glycosyltransferase involved in cell wall biosynthesis